MKQNKSARTGARAPLTRRYRKATIIAIAAFGIVVLGAGAITIKVNQPNFNYAGTGGTFHGPHYADDLWITAGYSTLSRVWSSARRKNRTPTTSTPPPITSTTTTPTSTTPATPPATTTSTLVKPSIGIAAGGGLTSKSQSELNVYFQALKDLGAQWVRWDIDWGVVQDRGSTSYDWSGPDRVAATAKQYGITSLGIITYAPRWAGAQGCDPDAQCAPADVNQFATFAGMVAGRYKGTIDYWEIWNEQNLPGSWSPRPSVSQYATMLKASYAAIKKANPLSIVIAGGLSAAADSSDGSIAPLTFVKGLYDNGAQSSFDALALHPYSYPASPDYQASWNSWQQIGDVRSYMVTKGDSAKLIWFTEYGAPTGGSGTAHEVDQLKFTYGSDYMSESAQQKMAEQMLADYKAMAGWTGPVFWYSLWDNGTSRATPENFFGLIRYDGSKKPAYAVFRNAIVNGI